MGLSHNHIHSNYNYKVILKNTELDCYFVG
jgi:hypothetical protein